MFHGPSNRRISAWAQAVGGHDLGAASTPGARVEARAASPIHHSRRLDARKQTARGGRNVDPSLERRNSARLLREADDQESSALKEPDDGERRQRAEHEEDPGARTPVASLLIGEESVVQREHEVPKRSERGAAAFGLSRGGVSTVARA